MDESSWNENRVNAWTRLRGSAELSPNVAPAVMFHHFCDSRHPRGQGAISADELAGLINWLGPGRILSANDWLAGYLQDRIKPDQICLTFDDNLRCQYDVASPVLAHYGLTAFWFVYTGFAADGTLPRIEIYRHFRTVNFADIEDFYAEFFAAAIERYGDTVTQWLDEFDRSNFSFYPTYYSLNDCRFRQSRDALFGRERYFRIMDDMLAKQGFEPRQIAQNVLMGPAEIADLHRRGHIIGLHSQTHPTQLSDLPHDAQALEYEANAATLFEILREKPIAMSHPCGSYTPSTLGILRELGIKIGFRSDAGQARYSSLELPRIDHAVLRFEMKK
ncbi:MAG: polysaccharide deacetylase family protein [Proteobacteria bacterium]|nr:polysaccharide deacetylase family protein [Pseudomonadota bacterium]